MKSLCLILLVTFLSVSRVYAGDDASGPIHYSTDFSRPFTSYAMSEHDKQWSRSLVRKLKYHGTVFHFVKTSLPLSVDGSNVEGAIYQAVEKPDLFYVINGDAMLADGHQMAF